jgi:hypothetical protein
MLFIIMVCLNVGLAFSLKIGNEAGNSDFAAIISIPLVKGKVANNFDVKVVETTDGYFVTFVSGTDNLHGCTSFVIVTCIGEDVHCINPSKHILPISGGYVNVKQHVNRRWAFILQNCDKDFTGRTQFQWQRDSCIYLEGKPPNPFDNIKPRVEMKSSTSVQLIWNQLPCAERGEGVSYRIQVT